MAAQAFDHAVDGLVILSGAALALDRASNVETLLPQLGGGELTIVQLGLTALFLLEVTAVTAA